jgi:hypothetical protein
MNTEYKITPYHLPRGTTFETHLYRPPVDGEDGPQWHEWGEHPAAVFAVDHILVVDGWTGRKYLVVTTTPNTCNSVCNEKYMTFNISHVSRVVKRGHKTVLKSHKTGVAPHKDTWTSKRECSSTDLFSLIGFKLNQEHPLIQFDIEAMFSMTNFVTIMEKQNRIKKLYEIRNTINMENVGKDFSIKLYNYTQV